MNNLKGFSAVSEKEMLEVNGGRRIDSYRDSYGALGGNIPAFQACPPPDPIPIPIPSPIPTFTPADMVGRDVGRMDAEKRHEHGDRDLMLNVSYLHY